MELKKPPVPPAKEYLHPNTMHKCNIMPDNQMFGIMNDGVYLVALRESHVQKVDFKYCPYCNTQFYRFVNKDDKVIERNEPLECGAQRKFIVLKIEDIEKYLDQSDRNWLYEVQFKIANGRKHDGRNPENEYLVINTDEKYIDEIIKIMKANGHWG